MSTGFDTAVNLHQTGLLTYLQKYELETQVRDLKAQVADLEDVKAKDEALQLELADLKQQVANHQNLEELVANLKSEIEQKDVRLSCAILHTS